MSEHFMKMDQIAIDRLKRQLVFLVLGVIAWKQSWDHDAISWIPQSAIPPRV
jgi:hypothetical protein